MFLHLIKPWTAPLRNAGFFCKQHGSFDAACLFNTSAASYTCEHKQNAAQSVIIDQPTLKPFSAIPGPKSLPFIGNLFRYVTGLFFF